MFAGTLAPLAVRPVIAMEVVTTSYPPTRSFQPRRRALPPARAQRYERLMAQWSLTVEGERLCFDDLFPGKDVVVLDIGFGGGEGLISLAAARPHEAIIGLDVHTPGVASVVEAIEDNGWQHVRVVEGDVLEVMHRIPLASVAGVRLYFPDPWPKQKQRHRRLARPDVVTQLVDRLGVGGTLHIATDIADYAAQTLTVCAAEQRLRGGVVVRPEWRPVTRFERRGLAAGREPIDMIFERTR
ncbi:MAG: tRNA (guanosine(46)-N7)-methyltransferase TrmB [Ilumatobacteraceae bacterium]|nr:tRNA (guanosine(46)-N7)-methyltransferase TrmB [Ilumatobacteraceae bacterium]